MTLLPSLDPGSSGYVSSLRCLGTRILLHQRAMRDKSKMRNFVLYGRALSMPKASQGRMAAAHVCAKAARRMSHKWWSRTGSNRRPEACKATALPTELRPHFLLSLKRQSQPHRPEGSQGRTAAAHVCAKATRRMSHKMVGLGGLEPPTSRLSSARSNQLSYKPKLSRAAHDKSPRALAREELMALVHREERETKTAISR